MNHQLEVQVSETGNHFIVLPDSVLLASNINIGDDVELAFDMNSVHFFDPESELRFQ